MTIKDHRHSNIPGGKKATRNLNDASFTLSLKLRYCIQFLIESRSTSENDKNVCEDIVQWFPVRNRSDPNVNSSDEKICPSY